jgi:hypothetical protein
VLLLLLQVLQHEIRKTHARNQKVEWVDDLVLMETIGKGGFGVVYKGSWKGSLAAIKVGLGGVCVLGGGQGPGGVQAAACPSRTP